MAADELPNFDELTVRVIELEHQEGEIERRLAKLQDRHGQFPNEVTERQITELHTQHLAVRREVNTIRARLLPIMRVPRR